MRYNKDDPYRPLDFIDWLGIYVQSLKAVGSLLCWIGHPMSEDELHQLSCLIERLTEDLEREIEAYHAAWTKED